MTARTLRAPSHREMLRDLRSRRDGTEGTDATRGARSRRRSRSAAHRPYFSRVTGEGITAVFVMGGTEHQTRRAITVAVWPGV